MEHTTPVPVEGSTWIPNALYDAMPAFSVDEIKVAMVIARAEQKGTPLTYSGPGLEQATGLRPYAMNEALSTLLDDSLVDVQHDYTLTLTMDPDVWAAAVARRRTL